MHTTPEAAESAKSAEWVSFEKMYATDFSGSRSYEKKMFLDTAIRVNK